MTHKICPNCKSPAPLEAAHCGHCGREYRTQFISGSLQAPSMAGPTGKLHSTQTGDRSALSDTRVISVSIVVMAGLVAVLILAVIHRSRRAEVVGSAVPRSARSAQRISSAPGERDAANMVKNGNDPVQEEAKRMVERETSRLQSEPPANSVGADGRIHLRGGGSITKEQWEDANRRLRSSPQFSDPMPPPPVN